MALGIAYATEDRRQLGLSLPMSIAANITLPVAAALSQPLRPRPHGDGARDRRGASGSGSRSARPSVDLAVAKLSGGNQQKVVLSKWLNTRPAVLILDEPTRGIDVGAKAEVHAMIGELAAEGMAIILISSDLPEVLAMSDRILVMREGRQMAILDRDEATQETVLTAAMGQAATRPRTERRGMNWLQRHVRPEQVRELSLLLLIIVAVAVLRLPDHGYYTVADLQPHRLERRHHRGGRGRPDARRPDPQHRPVGRLDRRLHRLFRRHADRRTTTACLRSLAVADRRRASAPPGAINGVLVACGRVPAIIATLGTLAIYRGVLVELSGAKTVTTDSLPDWLVDLPRPNLVLDRRLDIRPLVVARARHRRRLPARHALPAFGRRLFAIGSNPDAAQLTGLPVQRDRLHRVRAVRRACRPRRFHVPRRASATSPSSPARGSSSRSSRRSSSAASTSSAARARWSARCSARS